MKLFSRNRRPVTLSTGKAVSLLVSRVNATTYLNNLGELVPEDIKAVEQLFRWTRASIAIRWLRILETHPRSGRTWTEILTQFESQLFPDDCVQSIRLRELVNKLQPVLAEQQRLSAKHTLMKDDFYSEVRDWSESWISLICTDKAYVGELGISIGCFLYLYTTDEVTRFAHLINKLSIDFTGRASGVTRL